MKYTKFLFSPAFMGVLFIIAAVTMAVATFIENDYGPAASYSMVYGAWWFELVLILLALNMAGQLFIFRLFRREKLPVALFHIAFLLMLTGAGITRYFGWEGSMHIREGESQSKCYSSGKFIGFTVKNSMGEILSDYSRSYVMTSSTADNFKKKIIAGNKEYELVLARIIPNAVESVTDTPGGEPMVSLFITGDMIARETLILRRGDVKTVKGISIGFLTDIEADITITADSTTFYLSSEKALGQMSMMSAENMIINPGTILPLKPMQIITLNDLKIVPQKLSLSATLKPVSAEQSEMMTGINAFIFHLFSGNRSETIYLWDRDSEIPATTTGIMDGLEFTVSYGSEIVSLPFSLKLNDFVLERYPGSNSPSGYKSEVTLLDSDSGFEKPFSIFMNNILKYRGYRFYQSSYDMDEQGTILSVNRDMAGMLVTYTGYGMLFLFIIFSLFSRNSSFRNLKGGAWYSPLRKTMQVLFFMFIFSAGNDLSAQMLVPDKKITEELGKILVQDQKGRTKPLSTLSNDILRKVTRENKFEGYTSMQVFTGIYFDFDHWKDVPLIKVSSRDLQKSIGIIGDYASFTDLVDIQGSGSYKLSESVNAAYSKPPSARNKMDKEIMKVDERVNIVYMIYKGDFLKVFPLKDGTDKWGSSEEALSKAVNHDDSLYLGSVIPLLSESIGNNNAANAREIAGSITGYQQRFAGYALPSSAKIGSELLYYKMGIFEKLFPFYSATGLLMLIVLIVMVIRGGDQKSRVIKVLTGLLVGGFLFHTFGLGLRWYISGHSPMSNGYESMIFISWVTLLAGFFFGRKSDFALSATAVLAGMTLMVAHLSFMDPEITNLVPVLKSYWLTLHVSVITGSYGFLGLGALLGIITMVLLSLANPKNMERISDTIDELMVINFRTLVLGLYFLTIGTFLGAVWANESWGRYWGWDPKETWSLITIIVYTFVTHSRMIPGLKNVYSFNLLSLFGFSSVLMTYFGVNYYLSGLHSYAGGDPVPVPAFVYIAVITLVILATIAYFKYSTMSRRSGPTPRVQG